MQIPKQIFSRWSSLLDRGDKQKIKKETGLNDRQIANALKGEGSESSINLIDDFFNKKEARVKSRIKTLQ